MVSNLWTRLADDVGKDQIEDYLLSNYGPHPDGGFHDRFVKAGSSAGKLLGGLAGGRIAGPPGGFVGAEAGSPGGAWLANGAYRGGQVVGDIVTHPENWTVDAAGAIAPVMPAPATLPDTDSAKDADGRYLVRLPRAADGPSLAPDDIAVQRGVGMIGPSSGAPPIGLPDMRSQNPFANGIGRWSSSVAPAAPLYAAPPAAPTDRPRGLPGMLLDYLKNNPNP